MNLRPPGYEPGELPDCSTPRRERHDSTAVSLVLVALLVAIFAPIGGIAYAVRKGLQLFRDLRGFFRAQGEALESLSRSLELLSNHEPPDTKRLSVSVDRLAASRERLSVELGALSRVREQWAGLLAIYPRK